MWAPLVWTDFTTPRSGRCATASMRQGGEQSAFFALLFLYCGLQNNRPKDDEKIPENIFRGRKDPEKTVERSLTIKSPTA